jgi:hypothetical protein
VELALGWGNNDQGAFKAGACSLGQRVSYKGFAAEREELLWKILTGGRKSGPQPGRRNRNLHRREVWASDVMNSVQGSP